MATADISRSWFDEDGLDRRRNCDGCPVAVVEIRTGEGQSEIEEAQGKLMNQTETREVILAATNRYLQQPIDIEEKRRLLMIALVELLMLEGGEEIGQA